MKPNILYAFDKVRKAILSSTTSTQLCTANRMRIAFNRMFIYGCLTKSTDSSRFYANKLRNEYMLKIDELCKQVN